MKNIFITTFCIASIALIWNIFSIPSEAGYKEDSMSQIYSQLVYDGKNTASTEYPTTDIPTIKEFEEYVSSLEDDPDNLYDGDMIFTRGYISTLWEDNIYTVSLENGYDIAEADILTDKIANEILQNISNNPTDREIMAAICDYITNTYKYDATSAESEINNKEFGSRKGFVEAYYRDRKILCTDYAALTYLLANKLGVECKLMFGKNHVYNIVKFKDTNNWIGYDLAGESRYAQITAYDYLFNDLYKLDDSSEASEKARILNNGRTYDFAGPIDIMVDIFFFAVNAHHIPEIIILSLLTIAMFLSVKSIITNITSSIFSKRRVHNRRRATRSI